MERGDWHQTFFLELTCSRSFRTSATSFPKPSLIILSRPASWQKKCKAINKAKGLTLKQWYNRSKIQKINSLEDIPFTNDISNLDKADIYIICVSDSAIENLSNDLQFKNRLVVHTSGSVPMRNLNKKNRRGVFYPLQSFSKEIEISFVNVPLSIIE